MMEKKDLMVSGHQACSGCGAALGIHQVLKVFEESLIPTVVVIPACCWTIVAGPFPYHVLKVTVVNTLFETAASTASGIKAGLRKQQKEAHVLAWAGDGGTFDIGLQALSAAAERNEDMIYICYDNEAYMNTGIQRSSATPWGAWSTTTPLAKAEPKKDIMAIMAAHRIPYCATCSVAYPEDLQEKLTKARNMKGFRFIHLLCPCPPGWKCPSNLTVRLARLAVQTRIFPLYEIENGTKWQITLDPEAKKVEEYLGLQGRFSHLKDEGIKIIQENVNQEWDRLKKLTQL